MPARARLLPLLLVAPLALAGCNLSANLTLPASTVADVAEGALADQTGVTFELECGDDRIDVVEGTEIDCVATDAADGAEYDATITITSVDGSDYEIDVQVPDYVAGGAAPSTEPSTEPAADTGGDVLMVPNADIAGVAADALAPVLGFQPEIFCSEGETRLVVGQSLMCTITGGELPPASSVLIEITEVDGTRYSIDAEVQ